MLNVIARLIIAASLMVGAAYLPSLSLATSTRVISAEAISKASRTCPPRRDMNVRACIA